MTRVTTGQRVRSPRVSRASVVNSVGLSGLDLTIAQTSQCPVTLPQLYFTSPEDRKTTTGHLVCQSTDKHYRRDEAHTLIFTLATLRQRAAGARTLLLPKISLEPLYSDGDTSRRDNTTHLTTKAKKKLLHSTQRDNHSLCCRGEHRYLYPSSSDCILNRKDAPSPACRSTCRLQ